MRIDKNTKIYLGQTEIVKIKKGNVVIWESEPAVEVDYLYLENTYNGSNTVTFTTTSSPSLPSSDKYSNQVEYSTDKVNWTTLTFDTSSPSQITINQGEKLYLRNDSGVFNYWSSSNHYYTQINPSQSCILGGNVNTLLDYNNADNLSISGKYGCFYKLFSYSHITDASGLKLPATSLSLYCYQYMFKGCTSLTTAPALPATTLAENCYNCMFEGCTSLTTAPALPATTLGYASYCYSNMFYGCTSLTTAPALPATTLGYASYCYSGMFYGCTALTTAPALPATTLVSGCYYNMFQGCTSLTTTPALIATTLTNQCYEGMFWGCTSLTTVLTYADDISTSNCTRNWLYSVAPSGTLYNAGSAVYTTDSPSGIPTGWSEATAPALSSISVSPNTFTAKSWMDKPKVSYSIVGQNGLGIDIPLGDASTTYNIGVNTGSSSRTVLETVTYDNVSTTLSIVQSANDTDEPDYFYVENVDSEAASVYVFLNKMGTVANTDYTEQIEYSKDKITWNTLDLSQGGSYFSQIQPNEKMYFRNDNGLLSFYGSSSRYVYLGIGEDKQFNVGGSLRTLLDYYDANAEPVKNGVFYNMFYNMFQARTGLIDASDLRFPSTITNNGCLEMFKGCTSLTSAPTTLPATNLKPNCYQSMFQNCFSLTSTPALPATTLASNCYNNMFYDCSSLVNAPALPATTLVLQCYKNMFSGCSSLNSVSCYAENISASSCLTDWLSGVASSGTFYNYGLIDDYSRDVNGIPQNWTVVYPIQSIVADPDTFTIKSYKTKVTCVSTLTITTTGGATVTKTNSVTLTVGENTGDSTRTLTETIPYKGSSYQVTIVQTANDPVPALSWDVVSTGTYPFELNSNNYYESTNKGHDNSYSYATLTYEGYDELVLECINYGENKYDYGIISQPDVLLSESITDDGATGSANVFKNFKQESSATPVQLTIPSDGGSHFITIKFRKDSTTAAGNDSFQFKVIEPTT